MAIFLLPLEPSFEIKNDRQIKISLNDKLVSADKNDGVGTNNDIILNQGANQVTDTSANFQAVILSTVGVSATDGSPYVSPTLSKGASHSDNKYYAIVNLHRGVRDKLTGKVTGEGGVVNGYPISIPFIINKPNQVITIPLTGLMASTSYYFSVAIYTNGTEYPDMSQIKYENFITTSSPDIKGSGQGQADYKDQLNSQLELRCGVSWFGKNGTLYGCVAGLFYIAFTLVSKLAQLGAYFLDFFIYYSTSSTSYASEFVTKGWGAVRDIANIFFIIALLYVAIKMILSLGDSHGKKIIGTIIIVALLINFSLFFTQVIIDGSNILAKIFYNNIDQKYDNKKPATGSKGEKSISVGLVNKFNPELMLTQKQYDQTEGTTTYIFITFMLTAILLYTTYIFVNVGLLFVSRVIMLWMSMIFAPIAFASYTLPFDIPGLGHKEWWKNLLENAFLAPIFIFMLYLIVMFAGFLNQVATYPDGADLFQKLMSIVVPFIVLFILLKKAKDLAVKYAGEMGAALIKGAQMVGGVALGAVTGGAAMLGSGLIGGGASKLLGSKYGEKLKDLSEKKGMGGWAAKMALKGTNKATKSTFDVRKTALGGGMSKATGMNFESAKMIGLGSKEGGFKGAVERKGKKEMEDFNDLYKTKLSNEEVANLHKTDSEGNPIKTADQLNNHRMKNYTENIGKTGLMYSAARTATYYEDKIGNKLGYREGTVEQKANENYEAEHGEKKNVAFEEEKEKEYKKANENKEKEFNDNKEIEINKAVKEEETKQKSSGALAPGQSLPDSFAKKIREDYEKNHKAEPVDKEEFSKTYDKEHREEFNEKYDNENKEKSVKIEKEKILDSRTKTAKMIIGATAAVATGGVAGGMMIGGAAASIIGGAIGASVAGSTYLKEDAQEKASKLAFEKQLKTLVSLDTRIKELKTTQDELIDLLNKGNVLEDENGVSQTKNFISGNKEQGFRVDQTKIEDELAELIVLSKQQEAMQNNYIKNNEAIPDKLKKEMVRVSKAVSKLNKLKTAPRELNTVRDQLSKAETDKKGATTPAEKAKQHEDKASGGHAPVHKAEPANKTTATNSKPEHHK